jgi:tetratricopeptide (TPR) repeat protein
MTKFWLLISLLAMASCAAQRQTGSGAAKTIQSSEALGFDNLFYQATRLRLQGEVAPAIQKYKECISARPKHGAANYYLAVLLCTQGKMAEAMPCIAIAIQSNPKNVDYLELQARTLSQNGNASDAAKVYQQLAKARPALAEDYLNSAAYQLMRQGKLSDGLNILRDLEAIIGSSKDITYKKINLLRRMEKHTDAAMEVDKLIAASGGDLVRNKLLKLEILEDAGERSKAEILYQDLIKTSGSDGEVLEMQLEKQIATGDTAGYIKMIPVLVKNREVSPEKKSDLMIPFFSLAAHDSSKRSQLVLMGAELVEAAPNDLNAIRMYANILSSSGKYDAASKQYSRLAEKEPKVYEHWQQLTSMHAQQDNYDSLISVCKRGLTYFPNQASLHYMQGYALQQKEQFDEALKCLRKADDYAIGNGSLQLQILLAIADVYNAQGKFSESDKTFDRALDIDSNDATVLNNYAYLLSERGEKLSQSAAMSLRALSQQPNEKTYIDTYAWILYKQGNYEQALQQQLKAIELEGYTDATMLEHLGDIYAKLNDLNNALKYWQQAKVSLGDKSNPRLDKKILTKQP